MNTTNKTEVELLPCPFCLSEVEITRYGDSRKSTQYACTNCHCSQETSEEFNHGEQWNDQQALTQAHQQGERGALEKAIEVLMHQKSFGGRNVTMSMIQAVQKLQQPEPLVGNDN